MDNDNDTLGVSGLFATITASVSRKVINVLIYLGVQIWVCFLVIVMAEGDRERRTFG